MAITSSRHWGKWPIALMGWYLLAPPAARHQPVSIHNTIPIHEWVQIASFDAAAECQEHLEMVRHGKDPLLKTGDHQTAFIIDEAQCIASDDPRLRE